MFLRGNDVTFSSYLHKNTFFSYEDVEKFSCLKHNIHKIQIKDFFCLLTNLEKFHRIFSYDRIFEIVYFKNMSKSILCKLLSFMLFRKKQFDFRVSEYDQFKRLTLTFYFKTNKLSWKILSLRLIIKSWKQKNLKFQFWAHTPAHLKEFLNIF